MPRSKDSELLTAAAALEEEISAFADLAAQTKRESLDTDRSMSRAARALADSAAFPQRIEGRLKALVAVIDVLRTRQEESVATLLDVAHTVEQRAKSRDTLLQRFGKLGESAVLVNELACELSTRGREGAPSSEVLELLTSLDARMESVIAEALAIVRAATAEVWPEIERQADGLRQQVQAARNKLTLVQRSVARGAPS